MELVDRVAEFLEQGLPQAPTEAGASTGPDLQVATVALLLDLARSEAENAPRELRAIRRSLRRELGISRREAAAILAIASGVRTQGGRDLGTIAERIRARYDAGKRRRIVASLWRIVDAGGADESEEAWVSRVAELLDLSPGEGVRARLLGGIARA